MELNCKHFVIDEENDGVAFYNEDCSIGVMVNFEDILNVAQFVEMLMQL